MHKPFIHCFKTAKEYYVYDVNTDKIIQVSFETYNFLENKYLGWKSGKRNRKANKWRIFEKNAGRRGKTFCYGLFRILFRK